jgi:DNA invertase Pin-like site-specific DNA recombinase
MQTTGQKQASAEFFNTIGWVQTFEVDDGTASRHSNRSFTMPALKRLLDHLNRSLGRDDQ